MGTRSLIAGLATLLLPLSAEAGISFAPRESVYQVDGVQFKQLTFSETDSPNVTYQPPPGWRFSGDAGKLTIRPPDRSQAEGSVKSLPLTVPAVFDEATVKTLTTQSLASLPAGSTNVTLVSQEKDPLRIGEKETLLLILSYSWNGENYMRSTMFLNRKSEQIRFEFVSRATDFEALQRAFLSSHFSWHNL